ncbi:MAG TPA: amidohydrolase, partial [candidate division WOR-3 bacterium]|nr:amidohydrolase [candidate division WOR-3 bacterium]
FTTEAAYSLGLESETGRLAPGLAADFVLLEKDPRTGADCRVIETWCRGRQVYPGSER